MKDEHSDRLIPVVSRHPILTIMVIVLIAIVIIGTVFIDENGALNAWLNRWQTLITGVLATLAAYLTVRQIHFSDDRQEVRHEQLMALGLRRDALLLNRAASRTIAKIQENAHSVVDLTYMIVALRERHKAGDFVVENGALSIALRDVRYELDKLIENDALTEILDGGFLENISWARDSVVTYQRYMQVADELLVVDFLKAAELRQLELVEVDTEIDATELAEAVHACASVLTARFHAVEKVYRRYKIG
ncbi:MAG: hypothetical protein AAFQ10_03315 [Pseudomonadota bacterium]